MLSIGKLGLGQGNYYERMVARGADDYYSGRGEAPGRWTGAGAAAIGLAGTVDDGQLQMLMEGRDPRGGELLRSNAVEVAALDLTFSAPKSVSVLFAVGSEELRRELVACHEEAVDAAVSYLEATAVRVRRGRGGRDRLKPDGLVIAAYRHRMSRALDPQLHTHCIAANMARGEDGRWTALTHPLLYATAQTAGYLYQVHLRALVHERTGLEWGPVRKGAAELERVPRPVLEHFSQRRHEMRRAAEAGGIGLGSKAASQAAAIATRERKQYGIETGPWMDEVRARAAEHGLDRAERRRIEREVSAARERGPGAVPTDESAQRRVADRLASSEGLTSKQNTFDRPALHRALAEQARQGARIETIEQQGERFASREDVLATARGGLTTAELTGIERRLVAAAVGRASEGAGAVPAHVAGRALAECGRALNTGQRTAVEATVSSGHGVQVIEALAGTGKTYTAGVLRYVYQQAGYQVVGVGSTGRAARELAEHARIPSRTLDSLLLAIERGASTLPAGGVLVFDEAGMAGTRLSARLLEAAQAVRCKVIALGDSGQLASVQAGGWMRAVSERVGALRLSEVMRQRDPLERRALAALHDGKPERWLSWAREHGRLVLGGGTGLLDRAVGEWHAAIGEVGLTEAVMIARANDTRRALNERARQLVRLDGRLGEEYRYGTVLVAPGEHIICRQNAPALEVVNGTRGIVRAVSESGIAIETTGGVIRRLPAAYVAEHVEWAYALTGHGIQSGTVERAVALALPHELTKNWSYTVLSRARGATRLLVPWEGEAWLHHDAPRRDDIAPGEVKDQPTPEQLLTHLKKYMARRDDEDLAIEQLGAEERASGRADDSELAQPARELHETPAACAEPEVAGHAGVAAFRSARASVEALEAQLAYLATPEVKRLEVAERREQELIAHQGELLDRAARIPAARKLSLATDRDARQRASLQRALEGVDAELRGVRGLRDRLVKEVGDPAAVRAERAGLETALALARGERDRVSEELVRRELDARHRWLFDAIGDQPVGSRERRLWERAASGLARYRLEQDVSDERTALGELPSEPMQAERYERARQLLEEVRRELAVDARQVQALPGLPPGYTRLLGVERAAVLEQVLVTAREEARELSDEQLCARAGDTPGAIASLDRYAAQQALGLELERRHHEETAHSQARRAAELEARADKLGRRSRRERDQLRRDASLQRQFAGRHRADAERIELDLERLRASGRHPEQWLREHDQQLAGQIAARDELEHRREREIAHQAQLALTQPPNHVLELIGSPPVSGVRLRQEWERLALGIERHRLSYEVDVSCHGALGPDPNRMPRPDRGAYGRQRRELAEQVDRYRESVGMDSHKETREVTRGRHDSLSLER